MSQCSEVFRMANLAGSMLLWLYSDAVLCRDNNLHPGSNVV